MKPLHADGVAAAVAYADRWVEYQQRTRRCPGVAVAVRLGGELVLSCAHGLADIASAEPMSTGHVFRIASHSKVLTATLVAQLVEQGRLRYDDRLEQHLPWLAVSAAGLGRSTLREVLGHASGVFRDGPSADFWQLDGGFPDEAALRSWIDETSQVLPGNSTFKYSNVGYALLGQVLAAASGQSYADLVRLSIAEPLGLADTGGEIDAHARERLATGYSSLRFGMSRVALPHADTGAYAAATGCYSSAEDLSRFADALCLGVPGLLGDESKRLLQHASWEVMGENQRYGLGLQCFEIGGRRIVGHGGAFPGFITATRFDPEQRLVVVVLTNAIDGPAAELANGVVRLVDAAHETADEELGPAADRFTGRFFSLWGVVDVVRLGHRLVAVDLDRIDPADHLTVLRPDGPDELAIVSTSGMRYPGERVRYSFADDGSVRSLRFGAQTLRPLAAYQTTPYAGVPTDL